MVQGPYYIQCLLERMKVDKILFVIDLEQGQVMQIPATLSQDSLPQSFRYYDPLIQMFRSLVSD